MSRLLGYHLYVLLHVKLESLARLVVIGFFAIDDELDLVVRIDAVDLPVHCCEDLCSKDLLC